MSAACALVSGCGHTRLSQLAAADARDGWLGPVWQANTAACGLQRSGVMYMAMHKESLPCWRAAAQPSCLLSYLVI